MPFVRTSYNDPIELLELGGQVRIRDCNIASNLGEDLNSFVAAAIGNQPPWQLKKEANSEKQDDCRNDLKRNDNPNIVGAEREGRATILRFGEFRDPSWDN